MTVLVNFPKSGMGIDEGTVLRWHKSIGERVERGQAIVELETAKALQEVEAPISGTLVKILVPAGQTVAVNTPLGEIEASHE